ncbi:MAG TPA: alpha-amylase family glycosyl hydrolase, partial [Mucilaginibacter sp.]|nr:alpha-amylase family glycosyl hydrolase [Mucilaginibacter sp.]
MHFPVKSKGRLIAFLLLCCTVLISPLSYGQAGKTIDGHPAWIMQGNIYEVNVRQYTPQGTFKAFAKSLDRLKKMGVQTLWFMPINPISKVDRKGSLGSYYAVANYTAINPEFGTMNDFKQLVREAHAKGFKVIIDWVPNHTGADNYWLVKHPDFYVKDKNGKAAVAFDWTDTRQLDYSNRVMQDSMINAMKFWLVNTHIDGFRCDVAWNVPESFWKRCISELRKGRSLFMLAEGDKDYLHRSGFDATYSWDMFHKMIDVAKGASPAFSLDSIKSKYDTLYPKNALELYFTSNHDENSWNKADYGTFPGASHAPFAVFTQTMYHSVPLIYSGQEEPVLRAIKFFDKDTIRFKNFARARFYSTLLHLRANDVALASDASFRKVNAGNKNAVYAYVREKAGKKVLVILNLSPRMQTISIKDKSLYGDTLDVFTGKKEMVSGKPYLMKPWGYAV